MKRIIRWLILIAFFGIVAGTGSYAGARFTAGKLLGPRPPVEGRTSTFAYRGVDNLRGNPRAWVFTYSRVRLPGVSRAQIVVSPTGKLLASLPPDLEERIAAYRRSLEP